MDKLGRTNPLLEMPVKIFITTTGERTLLPVG
jgi:hypothetical protein